MANTVANPSASYNRMQARRKLCIDLMGGTDAMRAGSTLYLLKFDSEDDADYQVRLNDSFLVPFYEDAVDAYVGKIFAKPIVLSKDTPEPIVEWWGNVDNQGASGEPFLYGVLRDAIVSGLSFVLVDYSAVKSPDEIGTTQRTAADDKDTRPYWKHFLAQDVIEARVVYENGQPKLDRLRVLAKAEKQVNEWESATAERALVYQRGDKTRVGPERYASFRVFEKTAVKAENGATEERWLELADLAGHFLPPVKAKGALADRFVEIPVVCFYTEKVAPFEAEPPLRDSLADLCLQHYRKKSRLDTMIDAINVPIMKVNGTRSQFESANTISDASDTKSTQTRELRIGPNTILFTGGGEEGDLSWLEHQGTSITAGRDDLRHLEEQIKQAALDPLTKQVTGAQTATAEIRAEERSFTKAQVWALMGESAITAALGWAAAWMGLESGGRATFGKGVMESLSLGDSFDDVLALFEKKQIDGDALIAEAKRRGILAADVERAEGADRAEAVRAQASARLASLPGSAPGDGSMQDGGGPMDGRGEEDAA